MCRPEIPAGTVAPNVRMEEVQIPVGGGEFMPATLALPESRSAPAVLVLPDMYGRGPFYDSIARRLAEAGYVALETDYLFREGPIDPPSFDNAMARRARCDGRKALHDQLIALEWLAARSDCDGKLGTLGFCAGGTFVLNLAAERSPLATVAYYAFPLGNGTREQEPPRPLDIAHTLKGPLLGIWGDQDNACGQDNIRKLRSSFQASGVKFDFQIYPGLAHGFLKQYLDDDDEDAHRDACDAWTKTIAFYRKRLG